MESKEDNSVYDSVKNYYGKVLQTSDDLKTTACCTSGDPPKIIADALKLIPEEILSKYYGCGTPLPYGIDGLHVVDLGSGSGRDCYLAANFVGAEGSVTGVDMTDSQLKVSQAHVDKYMKTLKYPTPNLRFKKGYIEFLDKAGVEANSVDLAISNCVVNLSPNKPQVLQSVYDSLKEGGEFYFSDVYCDRRLPENIRKHDVLLGECLGGALYIEDFYRICQKVGFAEPRILTQSPIDVTDAKLANLLGNAKFSSITFRLFKLEDLESKGEDYGQVAYYLGTIPENAHTYALDKDHVFIKNKPMLVDGNTAAIVGSSWLKNHFKVVGDRSTHFGLFTNTQSVASAIVTSSGSTTTTEECCAPSEPAAKEEMSFSDFSLGGGGG